MALLFFHVNTTVSPHLISSAKRAHLPPVRVHREASLIVTAHDIKNINGLKRRRSNASERRVQPTIILHESNQDFGLRIPFHQDIPIGEQRKINRCIAVFVYPSLSTAISPFRLIKTHSFRTLVQAVYSLTRNARCSHRVTTPPVEEHTSPASTRS